MLKTINVSIAYSTLVGHISLVCHLLIINVQGHPGQHRSVTSLKTSDLDKKFNPTLCLVYQTDGVYLMNKVNAHI